MGPFKSSSPDVLDTRDFFRLGRLLNKLNHTFIALVPKTQEASTLKDFCPISLCNTIYKIFSKVLVNRLKPFLDPLISPSQKGFVPGRQILDAVISTQEIIHSMDKCHHPGMVLKLDISKACDRVNWTFLFKVLKAMGFGDKLIKLIGECISAITYAIMLNRNPLGKFRASRELQKGDPISPYLFIILTEVLASNLNSLVLRGALLGIKPSSMTPPNVLQ